MSSNVIMESISSLFKNNLHSLSVIGAVAVTYVVIKCMLSLWNGLRVYVLAPTLGLGIDLKSLGSWAVVTGCTDGIGKEYARQLARKGLNIVLISRSPEKLRAVAEEIESESKVKTKSIAVDFTGGMEIYAKIASELTDVDVGVLVNNVGMSYSGPLFLTEVDDQTHENIINVNCKSVTFLTKLVLPKMVEKKKGAIINIASLSGFKVAPLLTVYSASKAFVDFFTQGIDEEYRKKGIIVQSVMPGFVATKMSRIRNASFIAPSPESFARSALATVGVAARSFGCLAHALQAFTYGVIPDWVYMKATMSVMLGARARAIKKNEKTK